MSEQKNVGLSAPWVTYFKMVYNLLSVDPELRLPTTLKDDGNGKYSFWVESGNATKIIALSKVLRSEIKMGNVTLSISFRCVNNIVEGVREATEITGADFSDAFAGNPNFAKVVSEILPGAATVYYAVFKREIITFFNDDLTDYHANAHFIVADLVKEVANESNVNIFTEYEE